MAVLAAAVGFAVGRGTRPHDDPRLPDRTEEIARAREVETAVNNLVVRASAPPATPSAVAPSCPPCKQLDDVQELFARYVELTRTDAGVPTDADRAHDHAENASKLREQFFTNAKLDESQRAAIAPIVAQLDQTIEAPLARLTALETADHFAVSDWAQAHVEVYQAMTSAEQSLRELLSPQQREQLDETNYSLASQLSMEHHATLVANGLVPPETLEILETAPAP